MLTAPFYKRIRHVPCVKRELNYPQNKDTKKARTPTDETTKPQKCRTPTTRQLDFRKQNNQTTKTT